MCRCSHLIAFMKLVLKCPFLFLIRVKNKFRHPSLSHQRTLLINFRFKSIFHICELQVHLESIRVLDKALKGHDCYEYLRSLLQEEKIESNLKFIMETRLRVFQSMNRVPILLSLLVVALGFRKAVPATVYELYDCVLGMRWGSPVLYAGLMQLAYSNHVDKRRQFTATHARDAFGPNFHVWTEFICQHSPLVKVIVLPIPSPEPKSNAPIRHSDGLYQFAHLSVQEFLFLKYLLHFRTPITSARFSELLADPWFDNTLRIASTFPDLVTLFLSNFVEEGLANDEVRAIFLLLKFLANRVSSPPQLGVAIRREDEEKGEETRISLDLRNLIPLENLGEFVTLLEAALANPDSGLVCLEIGSSSYRFEDWSDLILPSFVVLAHLMSSSTTTLRLLNCSLSGTLDPYLKQLDRFTELKLLEFRNPEGPIPYQGFKFEGPLPDFASYLPAIERVEFWNQWSLRQSLGHTTKNEDSRKHCEELKVAQPNSVVALFPPTDMAHKDSYDSESDDDTRSFASNFIARKAHMTWRNLWENP